MGAGAEDAETKRMDQLARRAHHLAPNRTLEIKSMKQQRSARMKHTSTDGLHSARATEQPPTAAAIEKIDESDEIVVINA